LNPEIEAACGAFPDTGHPEHDLVIDETGGIHRLWLGGK
jgi:hypothetical protein